VDRASFSFFDKRCFVMLVAFEYQQ